MSTADDSTGKIHCSACGKVYRWRSEYAGRKVRCKCGQAIHVAKTNPAVLADSRGVSAHGEDHDAASSSGSNPSFEQPSEAEQGYELKIDEAGSQTEQRGAAPSLNRRTEHAETRSNYRGVNDVELTLRFRPGVRLAAMFAAFIAALLLFAVVTWIQRFVFGAPMDSGVFRFIRITMGIIILYPVYRMTGTYLTSIFGESRIHQRVEGAVDATLTRFRKRDLRLGSLASIAAFGIGSIIVVLSFLTLPTEEPAQIAVFSVGLLVAMWAPLLIMIGTDESLLLVKVENRPAWRIRRRIGFIAFADQIFETRSDDTIIVKTIWSDAAKRRQVGVLLIVLGIPLFCAGLLGVFIALVGIRMCTMPPAARFELWFQNGEMKRPVRIAARLVNDAPDDAVPPMELMAIQRRLQAFNPEVSIRSIDASGIIMV